jgi:hypothetical protein
MAMPSRGGSGPSAGQRCRRTLLAHPAAAEHGTRIAADREAGISNYVWAFVEGNKDLTDLRPEGADHE